MSAFTLYATLVKWNNLKTLLSFPRFFSITCAIKYPDNKYEYNVQLLHELSGSDIQMNSAITSKILKKICYSKSVKEVLVLIDSQNNLTPSDLAASLHVLTQHMYSLLQVSSWAYYNSQNELWIQTKFNNDIKSSFLPLLNSQEFKNICDSLNNCVPLLSNLELLISLQALLHLHFPKEHELSILLQQKCLERFRFNNFNLNELALLSSVSGMLGRNGFVVSGFISGHLKEIINDVKSTPENFNNLCLLVNTISYFMSYTFLEDILKQIISMKEDLNENISLSSVLLLFIDIPIENDILEKFKSYFVKHMDKLGIHDLRKVLTVLKRHNCLTTEFVEISKQRALDIFSNGYLRASDIVGFLNVFDICGWNAHTVENAKYLLYHHIHEFDCLLLKHTASGKFMLNYQDTNILDQFSKRIIAKLPDLITSVSCLVSILRMYSKIHYKNQRFHSTLKNFIFYELKNKLVNYFPLRLAFCQYLISSNLHRSSLSYIMSEMSNASHQFPLRDIMFIANKLNHNAYQMNVTSDILLENTLHNLQMSIIQRQNEISDLKELNSVVKFLLGDQPAEKDLIHFSRLYDRLASTVDFNNLWLSCIQITKLTMYLPHTLKTFSDFVTVNAGKLTVDCLLSFLEMCATVNFVPENIEELQHICLTKLNCMDENFSTDINLISLTHSSAVLGYFISKALRSIFTIDYMKNFDSYCKEKFHSPSVLMIAQKLLDLNRCVVLEYAELNIPWFHQNFHNSLELKSHPEYSDWKNFVRNNLEKLLGGPKYLKSENISSPYHYSVDLECWLTDENAPVKYENVPNRMKFDKSLQRVAILILQSHNLCSNTPGLLGTTNMKIRHLEILGYRVVTIPYYELESLEDNDEMAYSYFKKKMLLYNE